jgi:catechol 2,3-dioxygenase-like lactoylglutathione lyase family enzyme
MPVHRSRVGSIVIDCDDLAAGVAFWSEALGLTPEGAWDDESHYVSLGALLEGVRVLLQRVP